jgi:hypothetical protein
MSLYDQWSECSLLKPLECGSGPIRQEILVRVVESSLHRKLHKIMDSSLADSRRMTAKLGGDAPLPLDPT